MNRQRLYISLAILVAGMAMVIGIALRERGSNESTPRVRITASSPTPSPGATGTRGDQSSQAGSTSPPSFVDALGYPVDLRGHTVKQLASELRPSAASGDRYAQFQLYRLESICARIPEQEAALDQLPVGSGDSERATLAQQVAAAKSACIGMDAQTLSAERLRNLDEAASSGLMDAEVAYYVEGPSGRPYQASEGTSSSPEIEQWKRQSIAYLIDAVNQGDRLAMTMLSMAYENGQVAPKNLQLSLQYAAAEAYSRGLDPGTQSVVNNLVKQLSADQVSTALASAKAIAKTCCRAGRS